MQTDPTPNQHKYRVMVGRNIVGEFDDFKAATDTAFGFQGSVVLDMSVTPPLVVYGEYGMAFREEE